MISVLRGLKSSRMLSRKAELSPALGKIINTLSASDESVCINRTVGSHGRHGIASFFLCDINLHV